jgi:hypothetical protein
LTSPRSKLPGRIVIPIPWGNQPDDPADDPLAELIALELGRYTCLPPGFNRNPETPCVLGQRAECIWGVRDRAANFCMWVWIKQRPGGATSEELELALGFSGERVRFWEVRAKMRALEAARQLGVGAEEVFGGSRDGTN